MNIKKKKLYTRLKQRMIYSLICSMVLEKFEHYFISSYSIKGKLGERCSLNLFLTSSFLLGYLCYHVLICFYLEINEQEV